MKIHKLTIINATKFLFLAFKALAQGNRQQALTIFKLIRYQLFTLALIPLILTWLYHVVTVYLLAPQPNDTTPLPATLHDESPLLRTTATTFNESKHLLSKIYSNHPITFYCQCTFDNKTPDLTSCKVKARKNPKRMNRIEWEHIMPAHKIAGNLKCWKEGGRNACNQDRFASLAMSDMHNLVPELGEINADRSNYPFVDNIEGESRVYGECDIEIENKQVEPPAFAKGFIARSYLYMNAVYHVPLTQDEITLYSMWNNMYKPDNWEIERNNIIYNIQGNRNFFISSSNN